MHDYLTVRDEGLISTGQVVSGNIGIVGTAAKRPRPNIILRPKVFLAKESTQIKMILIASYFFSEIELATIDIHPSHRTI